jgi:hypothetical protein
MRKKPGTANGTLSILRRKAPRVVTANWIYRFASRNGFLWTSHRRYRRHFQQIKGHMSPLTVLRTAAVQLRICNAIAIVFLLGCFKFGCVEVTAQTKSEREAVVTFIVTDYFGKQLTYRCTSFKDNRSKTDFAKRFDALVGRRIPYGGYHFVLSRADVISANSELTGDITVNGPSVLRSLSHSGLVVSSGGHEGYIEFSRPSYAITGKITNSLESTRLLWVRLQPLYREFKLEAKVEANGEFRFDDYIIGASLLLVFDDKQLIATKYLVLQIPPSKEPIEVNLETDKSQHPD